LKAVAIGELAVDWLSLHRGETIMTATQFYRYIGGNATNVALGLARLGLDSAIISKIGLDIHGEYLLASLHKEGVDTRWVVSDAGQNTAQCYMVRREDGFPDYYAWPSPNASKEITPAEINDESFENSWIWHMAAVSFIAKPRRFAMTHAVQKARAANKIISFDAGFPLVESDGGRQAAWEAMKLADILKFNLAEAGYWSNSKPNASIDSMAAKLFEDLSPEVLVVTLAEKGAMLYSRGQSAFCAPYMVDSIGDVGPGDAFSAGMIYGLSTLGKKGMERQSLKDLSLNTWLHLAKYGACAGGLVTRSYSATETFPRLQELKQAMGETSPQS
jgi:sugar/nucleoside kinase (ribokinase family)